MSTLAPGGPGRTGRSRAARAPLALVARDRLRDAILRGEIYPGEPLVEADLSERFGMSKTPIREALRLLANSGLVINDAFRTWRVRRLDSRSITEIFEIRELLEPFAVRKCSAGLTGERTTALRDLLGEARVRVDAGDLAELVTVNRRLHAELCGGCGNRELLATLDRYQDQLSLIVTHGWRTMDSYRDEYREHVAIVEAVVAGDGARAASLMRDHVRTFGKGMAELIRKGEDR